LPWLQEAHDLVEDVHCVQPESAYSWSMSCTVAVTGEVVCLSIAVCWLLVAGCLFLVWLLVVAGCCWLLVARSASGGSQHWTDGLNGGDQRVS
jgi:Flp pilus assembly protein TadB